MTTQVIDRKPGAVAYELHHDQLDGTYTIKRVEVFGVFDTRDAARQHMIDTEDERAQRDRPSLPIERDLVAALAWCRLGGGALGRPEDETAFERAKALGLLAQDDVWRTTDRGDGVLVAAGLLDGSAAPERTAVRVLWARSRRYPKPQFVRAWSESFVEFDDGTYDDQRTEAERDYETYLEADGPWVFWTTVEHLDAPTAASGGDR